ncbi:hypothetical protein Dxin01_00916 [Deinococcus xinjiangensis]|uniref:GNAT family N-acetyltransferase n=2 Tax=Deinococcus xinjiangensis TaxID=457454 RepID=A0ABP9VAI8_9DEIO
MREQVRALFTLSDAGKLQLINDTAAEGRTPAPRFFLGRTREGNIWHVRHDLSAERAGELDALCRTEPPLSDGPPNIADAVRDLLPDSEEWRGPAYVLLERHSATARAVMVTSENAEALEAFPYTRGQILAGAAGPVAAVLVGGQAVSVCFCSRLTPTAAEAGLHTLEDFRGHGYALAAAALWAELVRHSGRLALYSTSWENVASQAVARKLNAVMYGEDWSVG